MCCDVITIQCIVMRLSVVKTQARTEVAGAVETKLRALSPH